MHNDDIHVLQVSYVKVITKRIKQWERTVTFTVQVRNVHAITNGVPVHGSYQRKFIG
jgi:hypothetical protein